jgi:hypothetical protein
MNHYFNYFLRTSLLCLTVCWLSFAHAQILIWGIPEKACKTYGGSYDEGSGLSEWKGKLTLTSKEPDHIAGTLLLGDKQYIFSSQTKKINEGQTVIQAFSLYTKDQQFSISASRINSSQIEFKIGPADRQATYIFDFEKKTEPVLIKGTAQILEQMLNSDEILMLPLLSYKLGAEGNLSGNLCSAAIPIHRIALAIAQQKGIELLTIKKDSIVRLSISAPGSGAGYCRPGMLGSVRPVLVWPLYMLGLGLR